MSKRKKLLASSSPSSPRIWWAFDCVNHLSGYLVTEPGSLDLPLAFVPEQSARAFRTAQALANSDHPDKVKVEQFVIWLGSAGRQNSKKPMPGFVYGLQCIPVARESGRTPPPTLSGVCAREPRPQCPFMRRSLEREPQAEVDVQEEADTIGQFLRKASGVPKHVVEAFAEVARIFDQPPKTEPDADLEQVAKLALLMFRQLPELEQRRILNGWKPGCGWPSLKDVQGNTRDAVWREMQVSSERIKHGWNHRGLRPTPEQPCVSFSLGTTKVQAISGLIAILARIDKEWESLIDQEPSNSNL